MLLAFEWKLVEEDPKMLLAFERDVAIGMHGIHETHRVCLCVLPPSHASRTQTRHD